MTTTREFIIASLAVLAFGLTIYITAAMTLNIADRNQDAAISNAVTAALELVPEPATTCKERTLINAIKELADNDIHLRGYKLKLDIGNIPEDDPWN